MAGAAEGQVGWVTETTTGTAETVTKFLPILSEGLQQNIEYLDSNSLNSRLTLSVSRRGRQSVQGPIRMELPNTSLATLLKHCFGAVSTTGSDPYTHTFTPGSLTSDSLTIQKGVPDIGDTVRPFTYAGCKVQTWRINANEGEIATLDLGIIGMTERTTTSLATATYDADWLPYVFTEGSLSLAGTTNNNVRSVDIGSDNTAAHRHRLGSATSKEPLETGKRTYDGTISIDFDGLTEYNRFVNGTTAALQLLFDNGTETLTIDANVQYVGETPGLPGFELVEQRLPFRCLSTTSDAATITMTLVNSESSAA